MVQGHSYRKFSYNNLKLRIIIAWTLPDLAVLTLLKVLLRSLSPSRTMLHASALEHTFYEMLMGKACNTINYLTLVTARTAKFVR